MKFCTSCGSPVKESQKFCTNCGSQLSRASTEFKDDQEEAHYDENISRKSYIWAVVSILIALGVAIFAVIFFTGRNNSESTNVNEVADSDSLSSLFPGKYPQASARLLNSNDLAELPESELRIMRNEIFARHGRIFDGGGEMESYFSGQSWYSPKFRDVSPLLTDIEVQNISNIRHYENRLKSISPDHDFEEFRINLKARRQAIDSISNFSPIFNFTYNDPNYGKSTANAFFDGNNLIKIITNSNMGEAIIRKYYYFENGEIIFSYEQYKSSGHTSTYRCYYQNGVLNNYMIPDRIIVENNDFEFINKKKELSEQVPILKSLALRNGR